MIRGPILPHTRDSLWALVASKLEHMESGLTLVMESLDCSNGELGMVDGLARDAMGGIVLVMVAEPGDAVLPARALAAGSFLSRVGQALVHAVPEANFHPKALGRVLLVGTEASRALIEQVCDLPIEGLQACTLEPFRLAGTERFAVRWIGEGQAVQPVVDGIDSAPDFVPPPAREDLWLTIENICSRIDAAVASHGDRYIRRITWQGHLLGEVRTEGSALVGRAAGIVRDLRDQRDVRRFGDLLLRAFARAARLGIECEVPIAEHATSSCHRSAGVGPANGNRSAATRHAAGERGRADFGAAAGESLRSSVAATRLTPEEFSALGDSASSAGQITEGSVAKDRS